METCLNDTPEYTAWLHQSDLIQSGYAMSMHHRPSRGGRIALLYKGGRKVKKIEVQHLHTIEYVIWQVSLKNKTITILGIHHPPPKQDQTNTTFLDEITELLTSKLPIMENLIILGDFNMHIDDPTNNNSKIFVDMMEALGLKQHVVEPTHQKRNIPRPHFHLSHIPNEYKTTGDAEIITTKLISGTIDVKKDVFKITKKKITNLIRS